MRFPGFNHPVCHRPIPVGYAGFPFIALFPYDYAILLNHVFPVDHLDAGIAHFALYRDDITQLYEGMPPIAGVQYVPDHVFEPGSFQYLRGRIVLLALPVHQFETFLFDEAFALVHAAAQMKIHFNVTVDVIKPSPSWVLNVDGGLPCLPPRAHVLLRERIGLELQFDGHRLDPLAVAGRCQVEISDHQVIIVSVSFCHSLPYINVLFLRTPLHRVVYVLFPVFPGHGRQVRRNLPGLYPFQPFQGEFVTLLAYLVPHTVRKP